VFSATDTIVAIATPPGRGGIGVVRVSGPGAHAIARGLVTHCGPFAPRYATFTIVRPTRPAEAPEHSDERRPKPDGTDDEPDAISEALPRSSRTSRDAIDHAIVTFFPAPHSYTGDDVVEISAHGSPVVLRAIVAAAVDAGARLAEPGEFTLRAFLNGRIDLMQAEAVADLVDAATPLQARAAFDQLEGTLTRAIGDMDAALFDLIARLEASVDFPEEGYHFVDAAAVASAIDALRDRTSALLADARRGRLIREGLQVAIVGAPNVGKSSLFNALVGGARAIVTEVPGTTRDLVTEVVDLDGVRVTLVDTAGLRDTSDPIEREGVSRSMQSVTVADLVLQVVVDPAFAAAPLRCGTRLLVWNKSDLRDDADVLPDAISVSAKTGAGLGTLRRAIVAALGREVARDRPEITNVRHIALVQRAHDALTRARDAAAAGALSEEFVLADLQDARGAFEEITGRRAPEDVLAHIFERFCIGK
jgi:tRNA modification GTPase